MSKVFQTTDHPETITCSWLNFYTVLLLQPPTVALYVICKETYDFQIQSFAGSVFSDCLLYADVDKKPSCRWGTARRGHASWNLVKCCTNVDDLHLKSSETNKWPSSSFKVTGHVCSPIIVHILKLLCAMSYFPESESKSVLKCAPLYRPYMISY